VLAPASTTDDRDDIRGLAADREITWPRKSRAAILPGVEEWAAVVAHFLVAESAQD
jgi:hypothetical protein